MVPKSSQNETKTAKKSEQRLEDDLGRGCDCVRGWRLVISTYFIDSYSMCLRVGRLYQIETLRFENGTWKLETIANPFSRYHTTVLICSSKIGIIEVGTAGLLIFEKNIYIKVFFTNGIEAVSKRFRPVHVYVRYVAILGKHVLVPCTVHVHCTVIKIRSLKYCYLQYR